MNSPSALIANIVVKPGLQVWCRLGISGV